MSAITELQREIRERLDPVECFRVTYSCGHRVVVIGAWRDTCSVCGRGQMRVVFKP
jgi:hypothetical protein